MAWRDFFYFSKGERRALILLLCIISATLILLIITDEPDEEEKTNITAIESNEKASVFSPAKADSVSSARKTKAKKEIARPKIKFNKKEDFFSNKYATGTVVELNAADTTVLKRIPGIGTSFANRIVKYRDLLGGFHNISQLQEVYGVDEEKYQSLHKWFRVDTTLLVNKLSVNNAPFKTLVRHPYVSYEQTKAIVNLRERKGKITSWEPLSLMEEFPAPEITKLTPYLSFE